MSLNNNSNIMLVLPALAAGGTERTAAEFANYLAGTGRNAIILLMFNKPIYFDIHPGVRVIKPSAKIRKIIGKTFYIFFIIYFIRSEIKKANADAIFALGYITLTLIATLGLKVKVITSARSSPTRGPRFPKKPILNSLYYLLKGKLRSRVDGIIAQSNLAAEKKAILNKNIPTKVIPNFLRGIKEYRLDRKNQIVTLGRCVYEKAQHYAIIAFSKLKAQNWQLLIIGDGPKKKELEELSKELGVSDRVVFTGFQKDVDYYLAQSKIFLLTSIIEGFPNALIEGMANGLAPVSFDCNAGPRDIIQDGENGFLVEVGNVNLLTQKLQQLIDNPDLLNSFGKKASNAKFDYNISQIGEEYFRFIQKVVEK